MNRYFRSLKYFISRFTKSISTTGLNWSNKWKRYIKAILTSRVRKKPEKMWCFYWDPYRQGLTVTAFVGISVLTIIMFVLLVIGVITLIFFIASGFIYLLALSALIGGAVAGGHIGSKVSENSKESTNGGIIGLLIGGYVGFLILEFLIEFGKSVWIVGVEFSENLALFILVTQFIKNNWIGLLGFIVAPAILVFTVAIVTISFVYVLRLFEQGVLKIYGIRNACPECAQKTEPAIYFCKVCGAKHPHQLIPSQYGVFKHKCINGHSLPTMLLLGRNKEVPHQCPNPGCNTDLSSGAVGTDKHIAFVGGQSSGKTCLLAQVTRDLLMKGAKIPEEDQKRDFNVLNSRILKGQVPDKTNPMNIYRAFQLILKNGTTFPYHMYLYDLAGEKFEDAQEATAHRFFAILDSIVFVFDPFSIPEFQRNHLLPIGLGVANQKPLDIIRNLSQVLERYNSKSRMKKISLNILMVKSDVGYLEKHLSSVKDQKELNNSIRDFIIKELNQGAFIQHIEHLFCKINYYRVSALGRVPSVADTSPFVADHLDETFDHIFRSAKINIK